MAYRLDCEIVIGRFVFRAVHKVQIESTWRSIASTCEIALPNLKGMIAKTSERVELERVIKTGDKVQVKLGYNGKLNTEFAGYVQEISPKIPFVIRCEDEAYQLKRGNAISRVFNGSLKVLLREVFKGVVLVDNLPDITLSNFVIDKATPFQVLEKLKELGLVAYYKAPQPPKGGQGLVNAASLFVGLPFTDMASSKIKRVRYDLAQNLVMGGIDLVYRKKEDVKLKAKATSILPNNQKIEIEVGDKEGEERSLFFRNISDKKVLKTMAESALQKLKYEGYKGSFQTYGTPYIQHSWVAELNDSAYPERSGRYLVNEVKTEFGVSGFRREIDLGIKVNAG